MNHTVLLVEDEEDLRELMRDALELSGYHVVAARDGQEALDELDDIDSLCVVLLDLVMPRMNGWDFYAKMRERTALVDVPVIVHSSSPIHAPAGVSRVLQKPVEFERLLSVIQEYCAPAQARAQALHTHEPPDAAFRQRRARAGMSGRPDPTCSDAAQARTATRARPW